MRKWIIKREVSILLSILVLFGLISLTFIMAGDVEKPKTADIKSVTQPKEASSFTKSINAEYLKPPLNYSDTSDFDRVHRGSISASGVIITGANATNALTLLDTLTTTQPSKNARGVILH